MSSTRKHSPAALSSSKKLSPYIRQRRILSLRGAIATKQSHIENMNSRQYAVYIMTNTYGTVLYTGVTNNLITRIGQHKLKEKGFTAKYNITKLVYYEVYQDITEAIKREKQIKGGSRKDKVSLIVKNNPLFRDLYEEII